MKDPIPQPLSPDRWRRIEAVFEAVADLPTDQRSAAMGELCHDDPELRREVEALLTADAAAGAFIEPPTPGTMAGLFGVSDEQLPAGTRLGPWEIERQIGTGGMGRVYLARRTDGQFDQQAALKIIKRGTDTDEVLRRFRAERQTLANLSHPNIARLLDGGMTEGGLPYLVMEYIEGEPIDVFCCAHRLTVAQRLRLFGAVCQAVHYAHQNLVVHRDIKPANVLVTRDGAPKLLDFGIARVLDPRRPHEFTARTVHAARPMTPEYASPEQVRGEPVSTASDTYSLGVLLYELLTGHRPYRLSDAGTREMERVICEVIPERPSTAVGRVIQSTAADGGKAAVLTPQSVSRTRDGDPRRLRRALSGDVDAIVLTAMRKEPKRRYASALQFAEDIDRHLRGLPVIARVDSFSYRARKFVRRHLALTCMTAALGLSLLVGVAGIAWSRHVALTERDIARDQRARADAETGRARQISNFIREMLSSVRPDREGVDVTVRRVLDDAAARIGTELAGQPVAESEVRTTIGQAYHALGLYEQAEPHLRTALALRRTATPDDLIGIARGATSLAQYLVDRAEYAEAMNLYEEALSGFRSALGPGSLDEAVVLQGMSGVVLTAGSIDRAERLAREAWEIRASALGDNNLEAARSLTQLAAVLHESGDVRGADDLYRAAVAVKRRHLREDDPALAGDLSDWGTIREQMGQREEAGRMMRDAVAIRRAKLGPQHPALADSLLNLGRFLIESFRETEAVVTLEEAVAIYRHALGPRHPSVADALSLLSEALDHRVESQAVIEPRREAYEIYVDKFGARSPKVADALFLLGRGYQTAGRRLEATECFKQALDIHRELHGDDHPAVATLLGKLGAIASVERDFTTAAYYRRESLDHRRRTLPPDHPDVQSAVSQYARVLVSSGRAGEALPYIYEAAALSTALPPELRYINREADLDFLLGDALAELERFDEGEPLLLRAAGELLANCGPEDAGVQFCVRRLVAIYERHGLPDEADRWRLVIGQAPSRSTCE